MARAAPGVERTIAVLNWLAAHPDQSFTLTDIVRGLDLNRATCHALLAALAAAGYVYRDASKAYRLGPALAAIGEIAHNRFLPVVMARNDMRALAERLGLACIAASRVGAEMVLLERAVPAPLLSRALELGSRYAIRGPTGLSFMSWGPAAEAERWLDALREERGPEQAERWAKALRICREMGYCYASIDPQGGVVPPAAKVAERPLLLNYLSAPVLDAQGEIIFSIALLGFDRPYRPEEIAGLGAELRKVCDAAAARIFEGERPFSPRARVA